MERHWSGYLDFIGMLAEIFDSGPVRLCAENRGDDLARKILITA
jgi:hypothetical protein